MNVFSPAKINLYFSATSLNNNGYHNIVSFLAPTSFGDTIEISRAKSHSDHCETTCNLNLSCESDNLSFKALQLFKNFTKIHDNFNIKITKRIPAMAGFGGGSSNATTTLLALNKLYEDILTTSDLHRLCAELGSDCPFFLQKSCAIAKKTGTEVISISNENLKRLNNYNLILFKPNYNVSTASAYNTLRNNFKHLYKSEQKAEKEIELLLTAVQNYEDILPLYNTFDEIAQNTDQFFKTTKQKFIDIGATMMLSGSGSGCFCIYKDKHLTKKITTLIQTEYNDNIFLTHTKIELV